MHRTLHTLSHSTVEKCVAECKGNGYRYAGLEYYGQCFCGDSIAGNKTETCGGFDLLSVYMDPTFPATDANDISDYTPQGCYTESGNGRALVYRQNQLSTTNMTTETCLAACKSQNYPLAGTEYASECYCGVVLGNGTASAPDTDCNMPCKGNPGEICGGRSRLNLYVANDLMSSEPCGPFVLPPPIQPKTTSPPKPQTTPAKPQTTSPKAQTTPVKPKTSSSPKPQTSLAKPQTTSPKPQTTPAKPKTTNSPKPQTTPAKPQTTPAKPQTTPVKPKTTTPVKPKSTTPVKPKTSTPVKPHSTTPVKPKTTTPVKPKTSTTTQAPVPTVSSICSLPNGDSNSGYSNGACVGGIKPPALTCNNLQSTFSQYPFKLYTDKDSSKCGGYSRNTVPQGCKDACQAQYNSCLGTYATSCKGQQQRGSLDSYDSASTKCKNQYQDCLKINSNTGGGNRCKQFGVGWS
ncbi:MAG: hypothetical protein Q9191_004032 [Dirinaria sp. TL-2023a]